MPKIKTPNQYFQQAQILDFFPPYRIHGDDATDNPNVKFLAHKLRKALQRGSNTTFYVVEDLNPYEYEWLVEGFKEPCL